MNWIRGDYELWDSLVQIRMDWNRLTDNFAGASENRPLAIEIPFDAAIDRIQCRIGRSQLLLRHWRQIHYASASLLFACTNIIIKYCHNFIIIASKLNVSLYVTLIPLKCYLKSTIEYLLNKLNIVEELLQLNARTTWPIANKTIMLLKFSILSFCESSIQILIF